MCWLTSDHFHRLFQCMALFLAAGLPVCPQQYQRLFRLTAQKEPVSKRNINHDSVQFLLHFDLLWLQLYDND